MKNKCQVLYATALFLFVTMCPSIALSRGFDDAIVGILGSFLVIFIIFLILREVVCWYWKINATLVKLDKTVILLESIDRSLKGSRSHSKDSNLYNSLESIEKDDTLKSTMSENDLRDLKEAAGDDAVTFAYGDRTEWTCVCGTKNPQDFNKRKQSCLKCGRDRNEVLEKFQRPQ